MVIFLSSTCLKVIVIRVHWIALKEEQRNFVHKTKRYKE